jgi:hypothetical protein
MRRVRVVLGLAAVVCAFGALSAPAFAAKEKPKAVFGKFVASTSGPLKGIGSVEALKLGPYTFTGKEETAGQGSFGPICGSLKSKGMVEAGESEDLLQNLTFKNCIAYRKIEHSQVKEEVKVNLKLALEFHSNHSAIAGKSEESEAHILPGSSVTFKGRKSSCVVVIPEQTLPIKAETKPEEEFETAGYETEEESLAGEKRLEAKYGPVRKRLDIEMAFKKIKSLMQVTPECVYPKSENGPGEEGSYNKETNNVEFDNGVLEAEVEEITLKNGNIAFVAAPEA